MAASLNRQQMENTFYGDLRGGFSGTGGQLLWRWVVAVGVVILCAVATFVLLLPQDIETATGFAFLVLVIGLGGIYPAFVAIFLHWQVEGSHFGALTFSSSFSVGQGYRLYIGALLRILLVAFLGSIVIGIVLAALGQLTFRMPGDLAAMVITGQAISR